MSSTNPRTEPSCVHDPLGHALSIEVLNFLDKIWFSKSEGPRDMTRERIIQTMMEAEMAGDDSAELTIGEQPRRVAMDLVKVNPKAESTTEVEGEVHDQEDLNGKAATLKIDGVGQFHVNFFTPTRFRGSLVG